MNPIHVQYLNFRFEHPAKEEPIWKGLIERWYQLDAFAYGLAQAYTIWKPRIQSTPAMILLASPQASNETDFQFARGGATSPAKFVHTLPSIRCSPLCQVMEWSGPVVCIQSDPFTQVQALRDAAALLESGKTAPIWVISVFNTAPAKVGGGYEAQAFILSRNAEKSDLHIVQELQKINCRNPLQNDHELQKWLRSESSDAYPLPGGFELRKAVP
jgi:hypothetical protein